MNRSRIEEQNTFKEGTDFPVGHDFPDETTLKTVERLTTFYTGITDLEFQGFVEFWIAKESSKSSLQAGTP